MTGYVVTIKDKSKINTIKDQLLTHGIDLDMELRINDGDDSCIMFAAGPTNIEKKAMSIPGIIGFTSNRNDNWRG